MRDRAAEPLVVRGRFLGQTLQGRGLFSVLLKNLPDIDTRTVREAEFTCNSLIGFNFGDGHLHNEDLITAVQRQAAFEIREMMKSMGGLPPCCDDNIFTRAGRGD